MERKRGTEVGGHGGWEQTFKKAKLGDSDNSSDSPSYGRSDRKGGSRRRYSRSPPPLRRRSRSYSRSRSRSRSYSPRGRSRSRSRSRSYSPHGRSRSRSRSNERRRRALGRGRRQLERKGKADSITTKLLEYADSEISSLGEVSLSALGSVDLSKESTVMKRLFKEYIEIRRNPLENVSVTPLPKDFTEWHGNLQGPKGTPYEKGVFHFSIRFHDRHPMYPPTVCMLSRIEHPCVHNGCVGLDFLKVTVQRGRRKQQAAPKTTQRYKMWSPAYTARSILIQLQAFLFEGTAEIALQNLTDLSAYTEQRKRWQSGVRFSVEQSLRFSCTSCKHRPRNYWPRVKECVEQPVVSTESLYLENAVCVFTRKTCEEAALGMGLSFTKDLRTGRIQTVHCVPDIISLNAFKGARVTEMWGQEFTHWIPIYLHHSHPERSLYLARRSLSSMYSGNPNDFENSMVLDFFPRLLCHLAVSFANAEEGGDALRALHAYCYMHRLFLQFVKEESSLMDSARQMVKEFIQEERKRHMEHTQAIGHIVILATFTGVLWAELATFYLSEGFDRQVRRIIGEHCDLGTSKPNAKIDATRISRSFQSTNISGLRFLMTQLAFNRLFVCPEGCSLDDVISKYDEHCSLVPRQLEDKLLEEKSSIMAVNNYYAFLECVGEKAPSEEELLVTLRKAVANSARKRYHGDKGIEVLSPEEFEKQRLGAIKPLEELMEGSHLHGNEEQWKALCDTRFGLTELPCLYGDNVSDPWKHLYLQHNLQELVSKLNDNPDFKLLYKTLGLSKDTLMHFDLVTFKPDNIKSHYYFLSRILELLPLLTHITISKGEIGLGEKGFKELVKGMAKSSGALQVLDIRYLGIEETHVSKLAEGHLTSEGLRSLYLEGNLLCTQGTMKLAKLMLNHRSLPNLAELNLKACQITDEGMKALAEGLLVKKNIRKLDLSKNPCGPVGLAAVLGSLSYSSAIEELLLSNISLTGLSLWTDTVSLSNALDKLFELTVSLKKLNFWNTPLANAFNNKTNLKHLAKNTTITDLDLGSIMLSINESNADFGAVFVSTKSVLCDLDLERNFLNVDGCNHLNERAKGSRSSVTSLNLSSNVQLFTSTFVHKKEKIAKIMTTFFSQTFCNVTHLNVSSCHLSADAAEVFGTVLSKNTALKELDLSFNDLGKHGARLLANGMASNSNLDVLKLDKNSLGAAGAHYLATMLAGSSCTLKELHLFCNYIDVPGATAICKALETNKHLQFIDLGMNRVRKRGAAAVISMLAINASLKTLYLKFNYIPDSWAIKLVKQLVEVPSCHVTTLKLAGNNLQHGTLVTIVTMLKDAACRVTFDLSARAEYLDPERLERTIYISPLAANVTPEMIKRMFYSKKCGAIKSVKMEKHRKKKATFAKAMYALVEFAHKDSVELAVDLVRKKEAHIGAGYHPIISRAGLSANAAAQAAAKSVREPVGQYTW